MYLRRFGVSPAAQGHGIAARLIDAAVDASAGFDDLTVVAREELPATISFWERRGFREIRRYAPFVELRRPLRTFLYDVPDAEAMRALGESLAGQLRAGDLVVLSGELGAGKTTFTQGIGAGLAVRGDVTSPTFVIAREHPTTAAVRRWSTSMPTASAASRSSTTSISTPPSTTPSPWSSGARGSPRGWPSRAWRSGSSGPWPTPTSTPTWTRGGC